MNGCVDEDKEETEVRRLRSRLSIINDVIYIGLKDNLILICLMNVEMEQPVSGRTCRALA